MAQALLLPTVPVVVRIVYLSIGQCPMLLWFSPFPVWKESGKAQRIYHTLQVSVLSRANRHSREWHSSCSVPQSKRGRSWMIIP